MSLMQESLRTDPAERAGVTLGDADERVKEILSNARGQHTIEEREETLHELIQLHDQLMEEEAQHDARHAEMAFLLLLRDDPDILENEEFRSFVAQCIDRESFYQVEWQTVEEVIMVAEVLYGFRFHDDLTPDQLTEHVRDLVRHALRQFERQKESAKMFELLQRAPIPATMMDAELVRLRNRLHMYEMRRVQRKKRLLHGYLLLQILLVLLVFPLLFQNFENRQIQEFVVNTTGLEIVDGRVEIVEGEEGAQYEGPEPRQFKTMLDSIYWSIITYASIGYGDVAPVTSEGKLLASLHGLMGVLTTGVIAGLILNWITPREV